jgi:hypothetical protein
VGDNASDLASNPHHFLSVNEQTAEVIAEQQVVWKTLSCHGS